MIAATRWLPYRLALPLCGVLLLGACKRSPEEPGPQSAVAPGSEAHIRAVTAAVDEAWLRANRATTHDWPSYGLDAGPKSRASRRSSRRRRSRSGEH